MAFVKMGTLVCVKWVSAVLMLSAMLNITLIAGNASDCTCIIYNLDYMHCSCCPQHSSTAVAYRIDYSYQDWSGVMTASRTCAKEQSQHHNVPCDCVFCGVISDRQNPFFKVCKDKNFTEQFHMDTTYVLNITVADKHGSNKTTFAFNSSECILKPAEVQKLETKSVILGDTKVAENVSWKPSIDYITLEYKVMWNQVGKTNVNVSLTREEEILIEDLEPNTLYNISITCKPINGLYESNPAFRIARSAAKRPEHAPSLVNYRIKMKPITSKDSTRNISLYWQPIPEEHAWANCTGYMVKVEGPDATFTQNVSASEVWTVLAQPLSQSHSYNVTLYSLSELGPSPPAYLHIPSHDMIPTFEKPFAMVERQTDSVNVTVIWKNKAQSPDRYGIFACKGTTNCQSDVQETVVSAGNETTVYVMENQGEAYLYGVVPYWGDVSPGLGPSWLCVFNHCAEILPPELTIHQIEAGKLSILIKESECIPSQNRGRAVAYNVIITDAANKSIVEEARLEASGPVTYVASLTPNATYEVSVQGEGRCSIASPWKKSIASAVQRRPEHLAESSAINAVEIAIIIVVCFFLALVCILGSICYVRRKRNLKEKLNKLPRKALSLMSSTNYVAQWVDNQDFNVVGPDDPDYISIKEPTPVHECEETAKDSGVCVNKTAEVTTASPDSCPLILCVRCQSCLMASDYGNEYEAYGSVSVPNGPERMYSRPGFSSISTARNSSHMNEHHNNGKDKDSISNLHLHDITSSGVSSASQNLNQKMSPNDSKNSVKSDNSPKTAPNIEVHEKGNAAAEPLVPKLVSVDIALDPEDDESSHSVTVDEDITGPLLGGVSDYDDPLPSVTETSDVGVDLSGECSASEYKPINLPMPVFTADFHDNQAKSYASEPSYSAPNIKLPVGIQCDDTCDSNGNNRASTSLDGASMADNESSMPFGK